MKRLRIKFYELLTLLRFVLVLDGMKITISAILFGLNFIWIIISVISAISVISTISTIFAILLGLDLLWIVKIAWPFCNLLMDWEPGLQLIANEHLQSQLIAKQNLQSQLNTE